MKLLKRYGPFGFWAMVAVVIVLRFYIGHKTSPAGINLVSASGSEIARPALRVGYRGALIKWGIASAEQFERARINDPEIAEACPFGFLHPVILTQDVWKSVAYRLVPYEERENGDFTRGSRIFWTPVIKIPAGELVFEDKQGNIVRGRCGNCTENAQPAKAFVMPPVPPEVDTPIAEFTPPQIIAPAPTELTGWPPLAPVFPPAAPGGAETPPVAPPFFPPPGTPAEELPPFVPPLFPVAPIIAGLPPSPSYPPVPPPGTSPPVVSPLIPPIVPIVPVTSTPEPESLLLFAGGLGVLAILHRTRV